MTNIGKTKEEIIFELLESLNAGNTGYSGDRVNLAIQQYKQLIATGIIKEE